MTGLERTWKTNSVPLPASASGRFCFARLRMALAIALRTLGPARSTQAHPQGDLKQLSWVGFFCDVVAGAARQDALIGKAISAGRAQQRWIRLLCQ